MSQKYHNTTQFDFMIAETMTSMDRDSYTMLKHAHVGMKREHSQLDFYDYDYERGFGGYFNALEDNADECNDHVYGNCHSHIHLTS